MSNQKRIALACLMYAQDHDDVLPPVVGARKIGNHIYRANWFGGRTAPDGTDVPDLLNGYLKYESPDMFQCPEMPKQARLTYRYNDLLAALPKKYLTGPSCTVLLMDGEDLPVNAGHSGPEDIPVIDCLPTSSGGCAPSHGATVRTAPERHNINNKPGATYTFADGHAKWLKTGSVYFPPRSSSARHHSAGEPDPANGTLAKGSAYAATFHVQ